MTKLLKNKYFVLLAILLIAHIFFTFYNLEKWASFNWDQVDNAWASLRILLAHKYPLIGMVAKNNSGMYIGPLYYYLIALVYSLTHLDPIASPILAGITRIFSFIVIVIYVKRLFNGKIALMSAYIYTLSAYLIHWERSQWPVNFIAPLSLMILYYLFQVSQNKPKYFIHLAALIGLSFNLHFTAVFYPIILLFALPVIPFHKTTWKYIAAAVGIGILFFVPQIIYYIQKTNGLHAYSSYFQSYYHGFHARRMLQLEHDAFIKFQSILEVSYPFIKDFVIVLVPIFIFIHYRSKQYVYAKQLSYFIALWFFIPWIVFTTYSGELTDYYFSTTLYIAIVILAYLSVWTWDRKNLLFRIAVSAIWVYYGFANIRAFANTNPGNLASDRIIAQNAVEKGKYIGFTDGDPQSYLYFYYIYIRTKQQPYKL